MATLTSEQKRKMHRQFEKSMSRHVHNYTKTQMDNAFQAFEDERAARETALFADVDTATSPHDFSIARTRKLYLAFMFILGRDGL